MSQEPVTSPPSHGRRLSPRYTRLCRLPALGGFAFGKFVHRTDFSRLHSYRSCALPTELSRNIQLQELLSVISIFYMACRSSRNKYNRRRLAVSESSKPFIPRNEKTKARDLWTFVTKVQMLTENRTKEEAKEDQGMKRILKS